MRNIVSVLTLSSITGVVLIIFGFSYPESNVFNGLIVVGLCILLGIAVKMMDQLIDEIKDGSYRIIIIILAIFITASMAILSRNKALKEFKKFTSRINKDLLLYMMYWYFPLKKTNSFSNNEIS